MEIETKVICVLVTISLFLCAFLIYIAIWIDQAQNYMEYLEERNHNITERMYNQTMRLNKLRVFEEMSQLMDEVYNETYINNTEAERLNVSPYKCGDKACSLVRKARERGYYMTWAWWNNVNGSDHATTLWLVVADPTRNRFDINTTMFDEMEDIWLVDGEYWGNGLTLKEVNATVCR